MDFKHLNSDKNQTPKSNSNIVGKVFSNTVSCDSPFRLLPNFSTPPSRFTKIVNPFESHLIDRLHLPTFSPSVFAQASTPKTDEKFKWTIDDISNLKPADIDEETISQYVFDEDPHVESVVQDKINKFFSEKVIVPSPMSNAVKVIPLITDTPSPAVDDKHYSDGETQTVLTLPPVLPQQVEDILKSYYSYTEDQQQIEINNDSTMYRNLFEFENVPKSSTSSVQSSPALSTGLSPIQFSPLSSIDRVNDRSLGMMYDMPELRECNLSPIGRSSNESRSVCRLSFSGRMSIDTSLTVPDVANQMPSHSQSAYLDDIAPLSVHEMLSDSTVNWDMEYKHVSLASPSISNCSEKMDVSNSNTPHSKIFTSQRKRLSDSFKAEENDFNNKNLLEMEESSSGRRTKIKIFRDDVTDAGYQTGGATISEDSVWSASHMFASTPSKKKN